MQVTIVVLVTILAVILICILVKKAIDEPFEDGEYDYDRENPNALVTGYNVAGTVYASNPNNTPGLGWVL
jgi:hypothetical protein